MLPVGNLRRQGGVRWGDAARTPTHRFEPSTTAGNRGSVRRTGSSARSRDTICRMRLRRFDTTSRRPTRLPHGRRRRRGRAIRDRHCMTATSSQRLNLRPTSRSMPTSSKPQRACSARDAAPTASMRAITAWKPDALATSSRRVSSAVPMPSPPRGAVDVDRVLDRRAVGRPLLVRRQRGEPDDRAAVVDGDDGREGAGAGGQPGLLLGERPGDEVERARRRRHLEVVDRPDRLGVAAPRPAGCDRSATAGEGSASSVARVPLR